jgi:ubiquinone/menaquinone biosynthesis C-methylase UbiE
LEVKTQDKRDAAPLRYVMKLYDEGASCYDDLHRQEQRIKYSIALKRLGGRLKGATSCLDCGCGTGLLLEELMRLSKGSRRMLVGLDVSAGMLREAMKKKGCGGFQLVRGDSNHLPFREGVFDLVFAFTILDGTVNGVETLRELWRVCGDDGLIAASALRSSRLASRFREYAWESGLKLYDLVDLKGLNEIIFVLGKRRGDG